MVLDLTTGVKDRWRFSQTQTAGSTPRGAVSLGVEGRGLAFLPSLGPELQNKIVEDGAKDSKGCSGKQAATSSKIQRI